MAYRRGARDRGRRVSAVEVESGGRLDSFDGNHTNDLTGWLICPPGMEPAEQDWDTLMSWLVAGHLAWAVFPSSLD